ncbi:MAG TPA: nucleoside-diphosphate sugar epimerase/dehydratase [Gemmatimonadaceae bacterium]|nr:nucleoside-diphosphate sugar epimerase/dehydratase [Gemmatimonadaceae bacterium]
MLALRNRHLFLLDALLLSVATVLAFVLRFEGLNWSPAVQRMVLFSLLIGVPLKLFIFWLFGLYRALWRYASVAEVERIFVAGGVAAIVSLIRGGVLFPALGLTEGRVPLSILAFNALATVCIAAAPRLAIRVAATYQRRPVSSRKRAVVAGAGTAGQAILKESETAPNSEIEVVAFVDDDPVKRGLMLGGVSVAGTVDELGRVVKETDADEVIIAIPAARGAIVRRVVELAKAGGARTRIIPTMRDILSGKFSVSKLRQVEIEDLLRRDPIRTDLAQVRTLAENKSVVVTGGGGSIGSELCRQIAELGPEKLVVLEHSENAMFNIVRELRARFSDVLIVPVICDIRNAVRVRSAFEAHRPHAVFHAAAHKHVPLMEENVYEAITNNVLGTRNVVEAALDNDVSHFVLISSDKAVRPTSVMGVTKRLAEQLVYRAARMENRNFVSVRFGNVLASNGSVVPIFLEQIRNGGPVTITHPEMRRYFMTIPEAVQLVLQAGAIGKGGNVFVLDMGEAVKVADLARDLIRLSGLEEDEIEIVYTGIRPGEKLYEELFMPGEVFAGSEHPKILRARPDDVTDSTVDLISTLVQSTLSGENDAHLREILHSIVPDYSRQDARTQRTSRPTPTVSEPAIAPSAR